MAQAVIQGLSALLMVASQVTTSPVGSPLDRVAEMPSGETMEACSGQRSLGVLPDFLVVAGGASPSNNEIALEKNVLYFQRTLRHLGYDPTTATIYFANGNNGQASIRYLDSQGRQRFKVPQIPNLAGPSVVTNIQQWFRQTAQSPSAKGVFFYFTGHGDLNRQNADNNALMLWNNQRLSVQELARLLDQMPADRPVVTMMAQCFSGSFANLIYDGGDPRRPLARHSRCGFFATIKTLPSVGCTPAVNEADYRDYSSSFFAGLSGRSRTGQAVTSADYNQDGQVSFSEAHAFAKVDEFTTDLPISTSEAWLQSQISRTEKAQLLDRPIAQILPTARPEQRYVITALMAKFRMNPQQSYRQASARVWLRSEEQKAYMTRLAMELINVAKENEVRASNRGAAIASLNQLLKCERGSWSNIHAE